jgi:hypothetical protein
MWITEVQSPEVVKMEILLIYYSIFQNWLSQVVDKLALIQWVDCTDSVCSNQHFLGHECRLFLPNHSGRYRWTGHSIYVCNVWCKSGPISFKMLTFDPQWPWPWPNLTWPTWTPWGQFQGRPHPYHALWNWAPKDVWDIQMTMTFGPQRPWPLPKQTLNLLMHDWLHKIMKSTAI